MTRANARQKQDAKKRRREKRKLQKQREETAARRSAMSEVPEQQHASISVLDVRGTEVQKTLERTNSDPLRMYHRRGLIDDAHYCAGLDLAELHAKWVASGSPDLERVSSSGGGFSVGQVQAGLAYNRAVHAVHGLIGQQLVVRVCCEGMALQTLPPGMLRHYRRPSESMPRLREALDDLAAHFKYITKPYKS